jgi:hypothetical protein
MHREPAAPSCTHKTTSNRKVDKSCDSANKHSKYQQRTLWLGDRYKLPRPSRLTAKHKGDASSQRNNPKFSIHRDMWLWSSAATDDRQALPDLQQRYQVAANGMIELLGAIRDVQCEACVI